MTLGVFSHITDGLSRSRDKFKESMNVLLDRGPNLDEGFWEELEDALVLSDVGGAASFEIVDNLRDQATRRALPDSYAVLDLLKDQIVATFAQGGDEIFSGDAAVVLFVGINGTGKTTTVGKIANAEKARGRNVILGSADTFRAAAIEQLQVWADRADVEMVMRDRGSDPASVCYETIERAEEIGADLVLIDTAGRLHTSDDLMRELEKVVSVVRKRARVAVYTVLVIDATTGQNGLQQAREFNRALDLDALIVTKLDGTAKGGIALAISHELDLPIIKIGVGEQIEDLRDFDAEYYVRALIGDFEEEDLVEDDVVEDEIYPVDEQTLDVSAVPDDLASSSDAHMQISDAESQSVDEHQSTEFKSGSSTSSLIPVKECAQDVADEAGDAGNDDQDDEACAPKMTWAQFVEFDDARQKEKPKKHFWEKW